MFRRRHRGSLYSSYSYDGNGNRTTATVNGVTSVGSADDQDRLLSYGTLKFTYNDIGQVTSKTDSSSGQITQYQMDVQGVLKQVKLPDGRSVSYLLDGLNRRVGKSINGALTQGFLYLDQLRFAATTDSSGNISTQFVYADKLNVPSYMIKGGVTYQILSDQLGSPRLIVNTSDGSIAQQIDFDEFGNVIKETNPGFQPFGFAGCLYDSDAKLCHFGAREYDPVTARWLSRDPLLFGGGDTNLYGYGLQDPINRVDPTGMASCTYSISSHSLSCTSDFGGPGYSSSNAVSGEGPFANNPSNTGIPFLGPLPTGTYTLTPNLQGRKFPRWDLIPNGGTSNSRNGFQIHGCSNTNTCSNGCVGVAGNSNLSNLNSLLNDDMTLGGTNTIKVVP